MGVFRQKSVAGMDRLHVRDLGRGDNAGDIQIALAGQGVANADRFIGQLEISRIAIGRGINDDGLDAHLPAGADDPQRDFTTIGYEYL